jgi:RNA polymerase sigma-70 factor, ECF subfamily
MIKVGLVSPRSLKNSLQSELPQAAALPPAPRFEDVYAEFFHEVSRWVRALGGLEADLDDLTQEVFIVVRRKLPEFGGGNMKGWLYRITQRTVSDYRGCAWYQRLLKRRPMPKEPLPLLAGPLKPDEAFEWKEAERWLAKILSRMSDKRRTVFILFEIEGYSGEEIAELEGVAVNSIWTRLHHARKDFAALIAQAKSQGLP